VVAWDATRPVPWRQLAVPFLVYALVVNGVFAALGKWDPPIAVGTVLGGLMYLLVASVFVKFGWNPPSFKRKPVSEAPPPEGSRTPGQAPAGPRQPPAPTKRTNAGNPRARPRR